MKQALGVPRQAAALWFPRIVLQLEIALVLKRYRARVFKTLALSLKTLFEPVGTMPRLVEARKWLIPMLLLGALTAASGAVLSSHIDQSRVVIPKMQQSGELTKASEREITEEIEQSERIGLVVSIAVGVFAMPMLVLGLAVLLKVLAWLIGRKAPFGAVFTTAAVGLLPIAVLKLVILIAAARQPILSPDVATALVPASLKDVLSGAYSEPVKRALSAVNFFHLWSVLLVAMGFAASTQMKPWRALALSLFVYALLAGAISVGVPGLMSSGGPS